MIDINLLPYEKRTPKSFIRLIILLAAVCLLAVILMTVYTINLGHEVQQAEQRENQWEAQSQMKRTYRPAEQKKSKRTLSEAETVLNVQMARIPLSDTLAAIRQQLPASGSVQQLTYDSSGDMTIQCGINSFSEMQQFIARLRRQPFRNVELTQISSASDTSGGDAEAAAAAASSGKYQVSLTLQSLIKREEGQ